MKTFKQSSIVSGVCAIVVSVSSGCAVIPEARMPLADLDTFVVDCDRKREQIEFINSQRTSANEKLVSRLLVSLTPWQMVTSPRARQDQVDIGSSRQDWMLDQILMELAKCPR